MLQSTPVESARRVPSTAVDRLPSGPGRRPGLPAD